MAIVKNLFPCVDNNCNNPKLLDDSKNSIINGSKNSNILIIIAIAIVKISKIIDYTKWR